MSEIPADIQAIAEQIGRRTSQTPMTRGWVRHLVAEALLAEREQCAKICDEFAKENWGFTELEHAGQSLAASIRADRLGG